MKITAKLAAIVIAISITSSANAAPPGSDAPPDSFPVTVINDQTNPVPVAGDVSAEVSGSIDVTSLPEALSEQLNTLTLLVAQIAPKEADFVRTYGDFVDARQGWEQAFGGTVLISLIVISTENDRGKFYVCMDESADCYFANSVFELGSQNMTWPHSLVIPFAQPIPVTNFSWRCDNAVEQCEITVNVVGTMVN